MANGSSALESARAGIPPARQPGPLNGQQIRDELDGLKAVRPSIRQVECAEHIGVSEAELLGAQVTGSGRCVRLDADRIDWIIKALPTLGPVMVMTRNSGAVHEKTGVFSDITVMPGHVIVQNPDIDLRIFIGQWRAAYGIHMRTGGNAADPVERLSLQFFDTSGRAVFKLFSVAGTNRDSFVELIRQFASEDQSDTQTVSPVTARRADLDDSLIDVDSLRTSWSELRDTHDFFGMLQDHRVGRQQALRLAGEKYAQPLRTDSVETLLNDAATTSLPIMCFVGNSGCIQIHTGPVARIVRMKDWVNVLDPGFNLHLLSSKITSVWVVRKPTRDGVVTSIEAYGDDGELIVQFFGARKPGQPELPAWQAMAEGLARLQEHA